MVIVAGRLGPRWRPLALLATYLEIARLTTRGLVRTRRAGSSWSRTCRPIVPRPTTATRPVRRLSCCSARCSPRSIDSAMSGPSTSLFVCDDSGRPTGIVHLHDLWGLELF